MGSVCKWVNCARERKGREGKRHFLVTSCVQALCEAHQVSTADPGKESAVHSTDEEVDHREKKWLPKTTQLASR